jgi:hypothetical protein
MSAAQDAFNAALKLGLSPEATQYLVTVSMGEGVWGQGWSRLPAKDSLIEKQTQALGLKGDEGAGSNNWGAVQGTGNAGSFPHLDHHADGSPYKGTFKRYLTSSDGAADMARILLKPNVLLALSMGNLHGAVLAQHDNGYFELNPETYYKAVARNYQSLTASLGWPNLLMAPQNIPVEAPEVPARPLPLSSGFLSSDWGPESSSELSESEVLEHAENYLKETPNGS